MGDQLFENIFLSHNCFILLLRKTKVIENVGLYNEFHLLWIVQDLSLTTPSPLSRSHPSFGKEGKLLKYSIILFSSFLKEEYPEGGRWLVFALF
jgi:hypothetical protein